MKIANEDSFNCKDFREQIRAFLDNELSGDIKTKFLNHRSQCTECDNTLKDTEKVVKILSNLKTITTTPEFNFQLKARIRKEELRLLSPLYRAKLYFNENIRHFLAVPAVALVIFTTALLYSDYHNPETMLTETDSQEGIAFINEIESNPDEIVYIYYVLDTVQPTDHELGIFLDNQQSVENQQSVFKPVNLISF